MIIIFILKRVLYSFVFSSFFVFCFLMKNTSRWPKNIKITRQIGFKSQSGWLEKINGHDRGSSRRAIQTSFDLRLYSIWVKQTGQFLKSPWQLRQIKECSMAKGYQKDWKRQETQLRFSDSEKKQRNATS